MDNDIVFLLCRFTTGDAAGQNMVTIATDALCRHIEAHCPVKPLHWFIEAQLLRRQEEHLSRPASPAAAARSRPR